MRDSEKLSLIQAFISLWFCSHFAQLVPDQSAVILLCLPRKLCSPIVQATTLRLYTCVSTDQTLRGYNLIDVNVVLASQMLHDAGMSSVVLCMKGSIAVWHFRQDCIHVGDLLFLSY